MSVIKSVSIIGSGTMGQGIAIASLLKGYYVSIYDSRNEFCRQSIIAIKKAIDQLADRGKVQHEVASKAKANLKLIDHLSDVKADLIIEAIVEKLDIKQEIFKTLESVNSPDTILVSNTSSLSINKIGKALINTKRFAGLHFFNPAHLMKLVEVVKGDNTTVKVIQQLTDFVKSLDKIPVVAQDSPGFIVNRVARPYYVDSLLLLEKHAASIHTIDELLRDSGFKMGPFELMDLIGIDVNYAVTSSVYEELGSPEKFKPSVLQKIKMEEGNLGRKTGKGFYTYDKK